MKPGNLMVIAADMMGDPPTLGILIRETPPEDWEGIPGGWDPYGFLWDVLQGTEIRTVHVDDMWNPCDEGG